jgi:hypothetical protein
MKIAVFWDVTSCGSYNKDVSEEHIASIIRMKNISEYFFAVCFSC